MDDAAYMALLAEVTKNMKALIACENAGAGKILNDALKLLGKVNSQTRELARKAATAKVVTKGTK